MKFSMVRTSQNRKTGPIAVINSDRSTCPTTCPFRNNGCYAETGPISFHWRKLHKTGKPLGEVIKFLNALRPHTLVRYGAAGDLPGDGTTIDREATLALATTAEKNNLLLFTYTHYTSTKARRQNLYTIKKASQKNFIINISTESLKEAKYFQRLGYPTALAIDKIKKIPGTILCPAYYKNVQCYSCGKIPLCTRKDRKQIITFPIHGTYYTKQKALKVVNNNSGISS